MIPSLFDDWLRENSVALIASLPGVAGLWLAIATELRRRRDDDRRQLITTGRRLNEGMCELDVVYRPRHEGPDPQLIARGLWPKHLFLLPATADSRPGDKPGQNVMIADMLSRRAVTMKMKPAADHVSFLGGAHVWSTRKRVDIALIRVSIVDRSSRKRLISRLVVINPME